MKVRIDTVRAREALPARHAPYWHRMRKGCYIGFRKVAASSVGTWLARHRDESTGMQTVYSFGHLDEVSPRDRFDTLAALAEAWFAERATSPSNPLFTVENACSEYVRHLRANARPATADDALGRFRRWVYADREFAETPLATLTAAAVGDWRQRLAGTPLRRSSKRPAAAVELTRSASALNRDMTSLRAALNLAMENGHVSSDLAWRSKLRPVAHAGEPRTLYLDPTQRRALIAHAPSDLGAFLKGLALLPVRPGTLAAMVVGDFDPRLSTLTIASDKDHGARRVVLPDSTAAFFAAQCVGMPHDAPLFRRADGTGWTKDTWKKPLKKAVQASGLPPATVAYDLRHSTITDLITLRRLDTVSVARIAGTSPAMIEKAYGHLLQDQARVALAGLAL
jgi:integrase